VWLLLKKTIQARVGAIFLLLSLANAHAANSEIDGALGGEFER
jgi:hypothetical protein